MQRFFVIPTEDLLSDPEASAATLIHAARRKIRMNVQSICPLGDDLLVVMSETTVDHEPVRYIFSRFRTLNAEKTASEINARWHAGQNLVAAFPVNDELWGLFSAPKESAPEEDEMES